MELPSFNGKWIGPILLVVGLVLLGAQVYAWVTVRMLSWLLIGGGIGCLVVGAMAWFYHVDDKLHNVNADEKMVSADEYDAMFDKDLTDDTTT